MKLRYWILAARPKTLPAAIAPVLAGSALAWQHGVFKWLPALLCMSFALLIQIATNYANDYFDYKKGTDNQDRKGPKRAVAQGWIRPQAMLTGTFGVLFLAFLAGINLVWFAGPHLIVIGVLSMLFAILYTGGPFPLAYLGLGDLFVLIFFGWIAVTYTYFVQAGSHDWQAFHLGTAVGCLSVNLLLVNNYRDYDNDKNSHKRTVVVKFGLTYARWQYRIALLVAILSTLWISSQTPWHAAAFAILPILPGFGIAHRLKTAEQLHSFNQMLKQTSFILLMYSVFVSILLISF